MKKTKLVSAIGAVAGATFALSAVASDQAGNPFQADDLNAFTGAGQVGFGDDDDKEGSCGEGHCGEDKDHEEGEGSCGEGSCGEGDDSEGSCGEGSCGAV